ncbi:MAG: OmpA family protein [Saprospiraceae bacterium]
MLRKALSILIFLSSTYSGFSSVCDKGDKAFAHLKIQSAIKEYEKCLNSDIENSYLLERLGDCYSILDQCEKAEKYYRKLLPSYKRYHPIMIKYASSLNCAGYTTKYHRYVDSLIAVFPSKKEVLKLKNVEENETDIPFSIEKVKFNSDASDYSPLQIENKIIFTSNRKSGKKPDDFTGLGYSNVYAYDTTTHSVDEFFQFHRKYNIGTPTFYENNTKVIFTSNEKTKRKNETYLLKLFISKKTDGQWSEPTMSKLNFINANNMHPTVNQGGTLLVFVSDQNPRYGMDLYYCSKNKFGDWMTPKRIVNKINSFGNEVFPVFIDDTTLIFSSDGLGSPANGLDMYSIKWDSKAWSNPEPLSKPFNSNKDDFGIHTKPDFNQGFFTSNRDNVDGHEDIYTFKMISGNHSDSLVSDTVGRVPEDIIFLGTIRTDTANISGAIINIYDHQGRLLTSSETNLQGEFKISLKRIPIYVVTVEREGYHIENRTISLPSEAQSSPITLKINMTSITENDIVLLENIYYDYDKYDLLPSSTEELEKLTKMLIVNSKIKAEIASHTDARGDDAYNLRLSKQRSQSVVEYLIDNGIDAGRLIAKGYGETKILNHCKNGVNCSDEEHRMNRRTELKIISL